MHGEVLKPTGQFEPAHRTYPWDQWFDGTPRRLTPDHFTGDPRDFRSYMYAMARKRGVKVAVAVEPNDALVFQSYVPPAPRPKLPSASATHGNGTPVHAAPDAGTTDYGTCGEAGCNAPLNQWGARIGRCATLALSTPGHIQDVHHGVLLSVESHAGAGAQGGPA